MVGNGVPVNIVDVANFLNDLFQFFEFVGLLSTDEVYFVAFSRESAEIWQHL